MDFLLHSGVQNALKVSQCSLDRSEINAGIAYCCFSYLQHGALRDGSERHALTPYIWKIEVDPNFLEMFDMIVVALEAYILNNPIINVMGHKFQGWRRLCPESAIPSPAIYYFPLALAWSHTQYEGGELSSLMGSVLHKLRIISGFVSNRVVKGSQPECVIRDLAFLYRSLAKASMLIRAASSSDA